MASESPFQVLREDQHVRYWKMRDAINYAIGSLTMCVDVSQSEEMFRRDLEGVLMKLKNSLTDSKED